METLKLVSGYATTIKPFLAAIAAGLAAYVTYRERRQSWRLLVGALMSVVLIVVGVLHIMR